ncbi:MAG: DUF1573 domain-containing protein [Phycisphaerae bacterium]
MVSLGVLLASAVADVRADPGRGTKEPKVVVRERTVHLGRMKQGEKATARFILENQGNSDLHIERVHASCGCTIPQALDEEQRRVEPGELLEIVAVFDSTGRVGKQRKGVTVTSNDPFEPRMKLYLTAEIVTLFEVLVKGRPVQRLSFGSLRPGEGMPDVVELLPTESGLSLEVESLEFSHAGLTYTTGPMARDDRTGVRIKLHVDPDAVIGRVMSRLAITANVGDQTAQSNLSINGEVIGVLEFRPVQIKQLAPVLPGNSLVPVKVSSYGRQPFDILAVDAGPNIEVKIDQNDLSEYTLKLRIRESATPGPFGTFLDICTNVVDQPLIRIPVFARVRPLVEVHPAMVVLYSGGGPKSQRMVKIESTSYTSLELGEIETNQPYITARAAALPGRQSRAIKHVLIEVAGNPPTGILTAQVRVGTNVEGQPEVLIPVTLIAESQ